MRGLKIGKIVLATFLVLSLSLVGGLDYAVASKRDDAEKRKKQAEQKIKDTQASLEGVNSDLAKLLLNIKENQIKQENATAALADAKLKLADSARVQAEVADRLQVTEARLKEMDQAVREADSDLANSKAKIGQVARRLYISQANFGTVNFVFGKATAAEIASRARNASLAVQIQKQSYDQVTEEIVRKRNTQAAQKELTDQVAQLKHEADVALAEANRIKTEREKTVAELDRILEEGKQYQSDLSSKKGALEAELNRQKKEQSSAEAEIAKIDAANRQNWDANQGSSGGGASTGGFMGGSIFQAPIKGQLYMNSPFGWRVNPFGGGNNFHEGVDIASGCGNPQYAAADGRVTFAGRNQYNGINVTINHGIISGSSWVTVYRHLSQVKTYPGAYVKKGQLIGITGTTGYSTGCHTHFELWKNGTPVNGWNYIYH